MRKPSATTVSGAIAVATTLMIFGVLQWRASTASISIGLWYDDFPFTLNDEATAKLGGPLLPEDVESIKQSARRGTRTRVWRASSGHHRRPPGASRREIVEGIGRGIARAAAHEFGHMILAGHFNHARGDAAPVYEGATPDRAAQYYGEMYWASSWPLLEQKIGRQDVHD